MPKVIYVTEAVAAAIDAANSAEALYPGQAGGCLPIEMAKVRLANEVLRVIREQTQRAHAERLDCLPRRPKAARVVNIRDGRRREAS
jgi:hypothetical protein